MTEPVVFEPMPMKNLGDCGLVCMCMLLGVHYVDVLDACPKKGRPTLDGLGTRQMLNLAKRLGHRLHYHRLVPPPWLELADMDLVGILDLDSTDKTDDKGHYLMFFKGAVYNPAKNEIWTDVEAYCKARQLTPCGIMWRTK